MVGLEDKVDMVDMVDMAFGGGHASGHASGSGVEWVQNNVKLRT